MLRSRLNHYSNWVYFITKISLNRAERCILMHAYTCVRRRRRWWCVTRLFVHSIHVTLKIVSLFQKLTCDAVEYQDNIANASLPSETLKNWLQYDSNQATLLLFINVLQLVALSTHKYRLHGSAFRPIGDAMLPHTNTPLMYSEFSCCKPVFCCASAVLFVLVIFVRWDANYFSITALAMFFALSTAFFHASEL